ncbi:uncharacterized protein LOC126375808 [Pectinophora gossypiella]|uniref:uncharacterized protein LOC126375808 n=1 Tax=Pectinophora gossypiella TaxID=13191 RepID=UPI00214ED8D3|nr:uncharacterized protein LOC126375808 [Pectinophora gossypiella]
MNVYNNDADISELKGGGGEIGKGEEVEGKKRAQALMTCGRKADTKSAGHPAMQPGTTTPEALQGPGLGACASRLRKGTDEEGVDSGEPILSGKDRLLEVEKGRRLSVVLTRCDTPVAARPASREEESMDSDDDSSCASMITVGSELSGGRRFLKRNRSDLEVEDDSGDSVVLPLEGVAHRSKRGRGRPPSTGKYVGLAAARAAYNRELAESLRLVAEAEVADVARGVREARATLQPSLQVETQSAEESDKTSTALAGIVKASLDTILMVASKSSQLKGTYVRALKDAAKGIEEAVSLFRARTTSEEVARLEAANAQLAKEVADLRRDLQEMRKQPAQSQESSLRELLEETARANAEMFGNMLNARLAGIEGRLLPEPRMRPPLAADAKAARANPAPKEPVGAPAAPTSGSARPMAGPGAKPKPAKEAPTTSQASSAPPSSGKKGKSKKKSLAAQEAAEARRQPASAPEELPWTAVVGRKAKAKAAKLAKEPQKAQPTARAKVRLRAPKTAAVTLTLVPGAEERGVTYASILSDAKQRVRLADLKIDSLRFRRTATGARMLEVGGEASAEKADSLASKLREVLSAEAVRVARPVKRAEIRVTGLDDSADAFEVAEAIAKEGGCPSEAIKCGRMVVGPRGDGSLWVSCPVTAAKKVAGSGRIQVGWTSARARLLNPRPMRFWYRLPPRKLTRK